MTPERDGTEGPEPPSGELTDLEAAALERLGYPAPPEVVTENLIYLRRGRDLALMAAPGSGVEAVFALAAATRCDPASPALQGLILSPTLDAAARCARAAYEVAGPAGLHVLRWSPDLVGREGSAPVAQLVAGRPDEILQAVRAGRLGLDGLRVLVLDGVEALARAGHWEAAEEVLDTVTQETQKIAVDSVPGGRLQALIPRQLHRARRWPAELFGEDLPEPPAGAPTWRVAVAPAEEERLDLLVGELHRAAREEEDRPVIVQCRDEPTARRVAAGLAARGLQIAGDDEEAGVGVAWGADEGTAGGIGAWFGLPTDLGALRRTLEDAGHRLAAVAPGEVAHCLLLARRAGWSVRPVPSGPGQEARERVDRFRAEATRRIEEVDVGPELLLLEPLIEAHGFPAVAAALAGWLRELREERAQEAPAARELRRRAPGGREAADRARPRSRRGGADRGEGPSPRKRKRTPEAPWTRLFLTVGNKDGVRPADLVGAITGETPAAGGQIGKIEIRDSYSLVEVETGVADQVIRDLGNAAIRGRKVEVRRDRHT